MASNLYKSIKGERRDLNPRMMESQPTALTTWPRSPNRLIILLII